LDVQLPIRAEIPHEDITSILQLAETLQLCLCSLLGCVPPNQNKDKRFALKDLLQPLEAVQALREKLRYLSQQRPFSDSRKEIEYSRLQRYFPM
jgi:hypothetical protein